MKVLKSEKKICVCCMEEHEVKIVRIHEKNIFKNIEVEYEATYFYCDLAEEFYADEEQARVNDLNMKNAYRKKVGLLKSDEISGIREKYDISQKDFCILLGWGEKTITRYEGHQVQDKAHDSILRKIDSDSEWYISLLNDAKDNLAEEAYRRYLKVATLLYESAQDNYLRKAIEANYVGLNGNKMYNGNTELSLDKVVDVIRYFAASKKVTNLYKVKLMKLLWYADALSYKNRGVTITGLVYQSMPMGAVPVGHNSIIELKGVPCEEVDMGEANAYYFSLEEDTAFTNLTKEDKEILNIVIDKLGHMTKNEIVEFMHNEVAYKETAPKGIIEFRYAENLQI